MSKNYLAVDLGSSNGKVMLVELLEDRKIRTELIYRFPTPRTILNGFLCTNTFQIYEEICHALHLLGMKRIKIISMGVDSWSGDFGFVNAGGDQIGLPVFYRDGCCSGMTNVVDDKMGYSQLYELTTQRKMNESTLCQLLAVKKYRPHLLNAENKILFVADMVMEQFTGRICSEITLASYSQMFSMRKQKWENEVFKLFDIPSTIQPEVVQAGECLGKISYRLAEKYGVNPFDVIAPAGHDTSSAVAAVPACNSKKWAFISTGSWFLVGMELNDIPDTKLSLKYNCSNTALAFGKNMLKTNITAMWLVQECKRCWDKKGWNYSYSELAEMAKKAPEFAGIIDTEYEGFFNPDNMPEAIVEYLKKTNQIELKINDFGAIVRIIYESIALKCREAMDSLCEIVEDVPEELYVIGGASRVELLNIMIASAVNMPLITGPIEASAVGNALIQAYGKGDVSGEEEIREIVKNSFESVEYKPVDAQRWNKYYHKYWRKVDGEHGRTYERTWC